MDTTQTTETTPADMPGGLALPTNVQTARPYQGGNIIRLAAAAIEHGWRDMERCAGVVAATAPARAAAFIDASRVLRDASMKK